MTGSEVLLFPSQTLTNPLVTLSLLKDRATGALLLLLLMWYVHLMMPGLAVYNGADIAELVRFKYTSQSAERKESPPNAQQLHADDVKIT